MKTLLLLLTVASSPAFAGVYCTELNQGDLRCNNGVYCTELNQGDLNCTGWPFGTKR